ncbi:hypothetical protein [Actinomadura bangladeshensis]|uniref:LPXTG cell wall anchor domain-containing protein n=1 Tax=Actinomadura bangladeshensis TaxID=453573 RepID=A0A6L9QDB1_9ACTN|nr:hypothetical protein [Actinomadura bangladeshensis]NEA23092.1 hypothetical protein [Actinomadura bangladeshensis]
MRASRLAAVGIAAGSMMLGMAAPALATPDDTTPKAGDACTAEQLGKTVEAADGTQLKCEKQDGSETPIWVKVTPGNENPGGENPGNENPGGENPGTPPAFKFGPDKVKLSSLRVAPGYKTTFTVTCPTSVSITSNGYTQNPLPVKKAGENTWTATGTFRKNLPNPTTATVVCQDYGSVKFTTQPDKADGNKGDKGGNKGGSTLTPKTPKIPTGRIDTGDGSMYMRDHNSTAPLLAAGWGALMAVGLGAIVLRRRSAAERS